MQGYAMQAPATAVAASNQQPARAAHLGICADCMVPRLLCPAAGEPEDGARQRHPGRVQPPQEPAPVQRRGCVPPLYFIFCVWRCVRTASEMQCARQRAAAPPVLAQRTLLLDANYMPLRTCPHLPFTGASVGRLGVVTELTFRIVPQQAVQRTLKVCKHS